MSEIVTDEIVEQIAREVRNSAVCGRMDRISPGEILVLLDDRDALRARLAEVERERDAAIREVGAQGRLMGYAQAQGEGPVCVFAQVRNSGL